MAGETTTGASARPRPWLLVALGIAVIVAIVAYGMPGKSATPSSTSSKPRPSARTRATPETVTPGDLEVHLDELTQPRPSAETSDRNPFRFYVPPPPPPPVAPTPGRGGAAGVTEAPTGPVVPPPPPPPPPIPLKFIGTLETREGKIAAFSDCRTTMHGKEGDLIDGRYRLVKIGVESVVMEYPDGRGRTTIRMSGQECVGK